MTTELDINLIYKNFLYTHFKVNVWVERFKL